MTSYTLEDYSTIKFNGFEYKMEQEIINIISKMVTDLGINTSVQYQPDIATKNRKFGESPNKSGMRSKSARENDVAGDAWERTRNFKSTKMEVKEGIDKVINDIRTCLNKLSDINYEVQRDALFQHISTMLETDLEENREPNMLRIANSIFDIASTNKFYSELYAILYKELTGKFPVFTEIIIRFISQYLENIGKIQFIDSNKDYDLYCENNKLNDKRKAMSAFLVNLMKLELISLDEILNIILMLQETIMSYIDQENKSYEVEEITENIYIFLLTSVSNINKGGAEKKKDSKKFSEVFEQLLNSVSYDSKLLTSLEKWGAIISNVEKCSQYKPKEHLSISSRTVFRYMDVLDMIKKSLD